MSSSTRVNYGGGQFSSSDSPSKHMPPVMIRNNNGSDGSSLHPINEDSNGNNANYFTLAMDKAKSFSAPILQAWNNASPARRAVVGLTIVALFWFPILLLSWGVVGLLFVALVVHTIFFGFNNTRQNVKQAAKGQFGVDPEDLIVTKGKQAYKVAKIYWNLLLGYMIQLSDYFVSGLLYVTRTIGKQESSLAAKVSDIKSTVSQSVSPGKKHHHITSGGSKNQ